MSKSRVVLASGVFDLLHYGHLKYLEEAKKLGGRNSRLVVVIARDSTVEKLKGKKPILPEKQRVALVSALKPVDEVILGYESADYERIIDEVKPDIIAIGYDQDEIFKIVSDIIERKSLDIKIERIKKFDALKPESSTKIKEKILTTGQ